MILFLLMLARNPYSFSGAEFGGHVKAVGKLIDHPLWSHFCSLTKTDHIDRRRKKIKCDGCEPTCSQCQSSGSQCTWLQTKDRAALSRQWVFPHHQPRPLTHRPNSYVQELEARLLHMESLFSQITPVLEQLGPSLNLPGVAATPAAGEGF